MARNESSLVGPLLLGTVAAAGTALAGLTAYATKNKFQPPSFLARYLATPNSLVGPLFPVRRIRRAHAPRETRRVLRPIEQVVAWRGTHQGLTRVLRETETNTFLVAKNGVIVHEWRREGYTMATRQSSWSIAKSVVSLIIGQLIADELLTEDTRLVDVLPEYRTGGTFDTITVGHLLDMRSGIDLAEEYVQWKAYTGVGGMMTTRDLSTYLMGARSIFAVPGTVGEYRSVDTQFLSMMAARVTGESLAALVRERLWNPLGTLDDATWTLDHDDGIEKGFMGLNASPRDFFKIGQLILDRGRVDGAQVVPEAWIDRVTTPAGIIESDNHTWGYGAQWWQPTGHETHEDMTALGVYGQFIYVNRARNVVIVKNSDYVSGRDEEALIAVFRDIAERL